jgi:F-type H+-transporting ATPase subunit gamma
MKSRRQIELHRRSLGEIRDIMNAMKNLAYMETRKLDRFLTAQHAVLDGIEAVVSDFVTSFPEALPATQPGKDIYLLIGSERGFCGDFNEALLRHLQLVERDSAATDAPVLVATGHKLHAPLEDDPRVVALLDGASVVEEVKPVLASLVDTLVTLQAQYSALQLYALYHADDEGQALTRKLLPPFQEPPHSTTGFSQPPLLNLPAPDFLVQLSDHYLFAALNEILYTSLRAENQRRVRHLDSAVDHLDERSAELARQSNARRQEEIIEEIEVILLSAASLAKPSPERH